jgi:LysM repeat protein
LIEGCVTEHANDRRLDRCGGRFAGTPSSNPPAVACGAGACFNSAGQIRNRFNAPTTRIAPPVSKGNNAPAGHSEAFHLVKSGDTLTRIARTHGTTVNALETANHLAQRPHRRRCTKLKLPEI